MQNLIRSFIVASLLLAAAPGCDENCEKLELKLCDNPRQKERCALMRQEWRRDLLSDKFCEDTLKFLKRQGL